MSSKIKFLLVIILSLIGILNSRRVLAISQKDLNTVRHFEEVSARLMEPIGRKFLKHDSSFDIHVRFRDAPIVNADADLYDGVCTVNVYIGIWNDKVGLIQRNQDDEFAAVLGHEIGHCLAKHSQRMEKTLAKKMKEFGGPDKNGVAPISMKSYLDLLAKSREFENQADTLGVQLMENAGFNPWAAVKIWERADSRRGMKDYDFFFKAHPSAAERADRIRELLESGQSVQVRGRSVSVPAS
jgi:predicted Zn-dependent protease